MSAWNGVYDNPISFDALEDDDCDHEFEGGGLGCVNCDNGWVHACCDDLCRNTNDATDCHSAIACRACNAEGDQA